MTRRLWPEVERRPLELPRDPAPRVVIVPMPRECTRSAGLLVAALICLVLGAALGVLGASW